MSERGVLGSTSRGRFLATALAIGLGLGASAVLTRFILQTVSQGPERHSDFLTYYTSATLLETQRSPYDATAQQEVRSQLPGVLLPEPDAILLYFLPPPFLLGILPFTRWSPRVANMLWTCLQLIVVWPACLLLLKRSLGWWPWLVLLAWSLLWYPMVTCIKAGQLSLLLLLAFLGLHDALRRGGDIAGGLWVALLTIKPTLVVLPLLLLAALRRWRVIVTAMATVTILHAVTVAIFGRQVLGEYVSSLAVASRLQTSAAPWRLSTYSLAAIANCFGSAHWPVSLVLDLGMIGLWVRILRRRGAFDAALSLPAASMLISPHVLVYDLVLCLALAPLLERRAGRASSLLLVCGFLTPWFTRAARFVSIPVAEEMLPRTVSTLDLADPLLMVTWVICALGTVLLVAPRATGFDPHTKA
jgi:hypothetical protein